ncbi:DUF1302 family protein [Marinimicrobium sp. ABcell2]|uniref:DUF1302 family protein n=1 Tax=Marinimicrobium sp. ABcell2 TaxID=3069751 RepID=UPI0027AE1FF2|nr:DUF1302 family protein [Marinimicrobium sp. ABcell2]MDQ2078003.1 hypothetical protein [Marinimicrobium sp. ABcell2]
MNRMKTAFFSFALALPFGSAQADFFGEVDTTSRAAEDEPSAWSHRGWVQQKTGYGYRTPSEGFTRQGSDFTRTETQLYGQLTWRRDNWRVRLAGSVIHDWLPELERQGAWSGYEFTREQRRAREWRWEAADSYLSWQDGDWWVKGGYQTLAWGESETLKVTDVLARRDQRWPGQEDLEDLRLPVPALTLTWNNQLDLVLLPEMPTDRLPAAREEFDPFIQFRGGAPNEAPDLQVRRGSSPGWAVRWHTRRPGLDAQFMLADVYSFDTRPTGFGQPGVDPVVPEAVPGDIILEPWRQQVAGLALQSTRGVWLLKTEQAWHRGVHLPYQNPLEPWAEHDQWRAMVAAEYSGIQRLTITGEFSWSYTDDHSAELASDEWQTGQALRLRYTLFNERLALGALGIRLVGDQGDVLRFSADWDPVDNFSVSLSVIDYRASDQAQMIYPYRYNDSVLLTLRRGF